MEKSALETIAQTSQEVPLKEVLDVSQQYVLDYVQEQGIDLRAYKHHKPTTTCFQKAELIGVEPQQVIKAIMLKKQRGEYFTFVGPETGTQHSTFKFDNQTIKKLFSHDRKKAKEMMSLKSNIPTLIGVDKGTCTPFVPDYFFEMGDGYHGYLSKIYFVDHPSIDNKIVDISIGGMGDEARKISVQGTYKDIYDIVKTRFPDNVEKLKLSY